MLKSKMEIMKNSQTNTTPPPEAEQTGTIWKHPYLVYVIITFFLFIFLVLMGWLAIHEGWLPNRGTL